MKRVQFAQEKIEGPAIVYTFLGIVIDMDWFDVRLLEEKLVHMKEIVTSWLGRCSERYKELESLVGHLSHVATVIHNGRIFLHHLLVLSMDRSRNHFIYLDQAAHADL